MLFATVTVKPGRGEATSAVLAVGRVRRVQPRALAAAGGLDAPGPRLARNRDRERAEHPRDAQKDERDGVETAGDSQADREREPGRDDDPGGRAQGPSTITVPFMPCSSCGMQKY